MKDHFRFAAGTKVFSVIGRFFRVGREKPRQSVRTPTKTGGFFINYSKSVGYEKKRHFSIKANRSESQRLKRLKKVKKSVGEPPGFRYVVRSSGLAPGMERPQIRPCVRAGGHNNTQSNPVFRGMVRRLVASG